MYEEIYLSGACKNVKDGGNQWRHRVAYIMSEEYTVFNPNDHYNYSDKIPNSEKECLKLFLRKLKECEVVLVNLDDSAKSPGTLAELAIAYDNRIPIIGFGTKNIYGWAKEFCDVVFEEEGDAVDYIFDHY